MNCPYLTNSLVRNNHQKFLRGFQAWGEFCVIIEKKMKKNFSNYFHLRTWVIFSTNLRKSLFIESFLYREFPQNIMTPGVHREYTVNTHDNCNNLPLINLKSLRHTINCCNVISLLWHYQFAFTCSQNVRPLLLPGIILPERTKQLENVFVNVISK